MQLGFFQLLWQNRHRVGLIPDGYLSLTGHDEPGSHFRITGIRAPEGRYRGSRPNLMPIQ